MLHLSAGLACAQLQTLLLLHVEHMGGRQETIYEMRFSNSGSADESVQFTMLVTCGTSRGLAGRQLRSSGRTRRPIHSCRVRYSRG
jgi:hypothetical protein